MLRYVESHSAQTRFLLESCQEAEPLLQTIHAPVAANSQREHFFRVQDHGIGDVGQRHFLDSIFCR